MNIDDIDRKWINIGAGVAIMICLLGTVAVWSIWSHPAPDDEVIMNTTIDEKPAPTPTPAPEPTTEPTNAENVTVAEQMNESNMTGQTTVTSGATPEQEEKEFSMAVDGETIQITDDDIHNAVMNCSIKDMTFEEFKQYVRDSKTEE